MKDIGGVNRVEYASVEIVYLTTQFRRGFLALGGISHIHIYFNRLEMGATSKTAQEIEKMRVAGQLAAQVLEMIEPHVQVGITTGELDKICHDYITKVQGAIPAPLNYNGFPKSICTSVNEVICHGIPSDTKRLKNGDIINN